MNPNPSDFTSLINAIPPQTISANGETLSSAIDTQGFRYAHILGLHGTITSTATVAWAVYECATSGGQYTAVTGAIFAAATTDNAEREMEIDLRGRQRYLKVGVTHASSGDAPLACAVLLWGPDNTGRATGAANVVRV